MTPRHAPPFTLLVLAAAAVAFAHAPPARAYCAAGWSWSGFTSVRVFHSPDLAANLKHADGTTWTEEELNEEISWLLQTANYYSNATLPVFYNAGQSHICSGDAACRIPNAINIFPSTSCESVHWGNPTEGSRIQLGSSLWCPTAKYEHLSAATDWAKMFFSGLFLHEFGHALGLAHPGDCGPVTCTTPPCQVLNVNAGNNYEALSWYADDVAALQFVYGTATYSNKVQRESADASVWWDLDGSELGIPPFQPLFALSSSASSEYMFAVSRDPVTTRPVAHRWNYWPMTWTPWGYAPTLTTQGSVGAGYNPATNRGYSFYLRGETPTNVLKSPAFSEYLAAGSSTELSAPSITTRRHGAGGTYDPKSGTRIITWRTTEARIQLAVSNGTTFTNPFSVPGPGGVPVQAFDTPSIACGDASISRNCILAWAEPAATGSGLHYHTLRWTHFRAFMKAGVWYLDMGPLMSGPYLMHGSPVVGFRGAVGDSRRFVLTWAIQNGLDGGVPYFATYTIAKLTTDSSTWDPATLAGHAQYQWRLAPGIGSAAGDSELVFTRRLP